MITFRPDDHTYWHDSGLEYPSNTRVLKAAGIYEVPVQAEEYHRERGKAVHAGAALVVADEWDPGTTDERIRGRIQACANFVQTFGFKPRYREQVVWSYEHKLAGQFDGGGLITLTEWAGKEVLIDWKSSKPPDGVEIQLALYDRMAEETLHSKFDERWAVWLRDDGTYRVFRYNGPEAISVGLGAVWIWHWKRNHKL